ncbi:Hypp3843 [Branchiostoma lanceolatum]|uniref:Hypp3843 protein n=1 Tax=Branchiostoma lanceolatum TaxID=7740 RepID=A0A8K0A8C8_BRALA|nr:Hypp3843 [Branchiostoma lanceolatum]
MKDVRKLAKRWEEKSQSCVEQYFTQFQATEIPVANQIWQRAKDRFEESSGKVSTSNRDNVWIQASDEEDRRGGVVVLIGTTEAVTEAELVCKTLIKETEKLLKWEASIVTDHITKMKAVKLKILQLNNFPEKHPDVDIRLDVDNQSVDFKGQQALVQKAKIDVYETTNKLAEERVPLSRGKLSYLKSDKGRDHLEDSLKRKDIKVAFAVENEEMTILGQLFIDVKAAKDLLQQVVSESPIAIAEESRDLLTKQSFASLSTNLRQRLSVDIHIAKDKVWVVGPTEKVANASKDIKTYIT